MSAHGPTVLWYVTRGAGAMTLVLLTASVVLGIAEWRGWQPAGAPRFAVASMHRTVGLLALALLVVHVATTLLDPFPHIGLLNAAVPFVTSYRPLWVGLGTLAADVMVAVVVTSLVRRRLGYRAWRGVHWLSYACWPVALLHGIGAGSDTKSTWMLGLTLACVAAVVVALGARVAAAETPQFVRAAAFPGMAVGVIVLGVWLAQGPLARGWAPRAGTPRKVLAGFSPRRPVPVAGRQDALARPFSTSLDGEIRNGLSPAGTGVVDLRMRLREGPGGVLTIRLGGDTLPDGGLHMNRSAVSLRSADGSGEYRGRVVSLSGTDLRALVGSANGHALRLDVSLALGGQVVGGELRSRPVPESGA
jgi:sulfoxide reductase heme-binding subunit YedZ